MQRRVQKDPIAEYSTRLCAYINGQPAVALSYARYFGEYPTATKATMTSIDQNGFDIVCHDQGEEHEVRVTFGHSLHAASQAKHELDTLAKEAEAALRGNSPQSQNLMPDSPSAMLPDLDTLAMVLLCMGSVAIYLNFFPNTTNPTLQWVLKTAGPWRINLVVQGLAILHIIESLVSVYFTVVVGQGFFQPADVIQWALVVVVFGYPSLFYLIRLATRQQQQRVAQAQAQASAQDQAQAQARE
ncbi:hypothetical protein BGZ88_009894 [Linnemannia elongata]|nr:hypothetical protein BGZ88_009894 [Linnemannia elongata]KAG0067330.1 hypothetical protein BGZ89_006197 [Linnemannia elongata]